MVSPKVVVNEMAELKVLMNMETPDTPSGKYAKVLAEKVAKVYIDWGRKEAISFLSGYWYATGVRNYDATEKVANVFGLSIRDGDMF